MGRCRRRSSGPCRGRRSGRCRRRRSPGGIALESAYAACRVPLEQVTDKAQLLELSGQEVWLVAGDERNVKITTPDDLHAARAYLDQAGEASR